MIVYGGFRSNTLTVNPRVGNGVIFFSGGRRTVADPGPGHLIESGRRGRRLSLSHRT